MTLISPFPSPQTNTTQHTGAEELGHLRRNFLLEVGFNALWSVSPILCVLVSFWVYTSIIGKELTPSVAFASLAVWNELRFALNSAPEILVNAIQCLVSLRRIEKYLATPDVALIVEGESATAVEEESQAPAFHSATVTWPSVSEDGLSTPAPSASGTSTPAGVPQTFELQDVDVAFPFEKMSLICGSLGSGKTLMLLGASLLFTPLTFSFD